MSADHSESKKQHVLEVFVFGNFLARCGTYLLSEKACNSKKTWELFKYFLLNKGKRLSPEIVIDTLWPQQEYLDQKACFRYHVHKLRQFFRQACLTQNTVNIVSSHGCYCLETGQDFWLDADEFDALSRKAVRLSQYSSSEAINTYLDAINLYKGNYLPEITDSWVFPIRNYYRSRYIKNILGLSLLLRDAHAYSQITEICERAFMIEPLEEELHLLFLDALLKEGKTEQAREHYEYITMEIYHQAGGKPSRAMRRIYQAIKADTKKATLDFSDIQEMLKARGKTDGALLCEPEYFCFLCNLERRRSDRSKNIINIILLNCTGPDLQRVPSTDLQKSAEILKQVLLSNLRKGDVVSQCNEAHFFLLLTEQRYEQVEKVLKRIEEIFARVCLLEGVVLRKGVDLLPPWE